MNFPEHLLSDLWLQSAWGGLVLVWLWCVKSAPWRRLADSLQQNVWLGCTVVLALLWSLKAGVRPGLNFHLLGATVATYMFGRPLAIIGLSLVLAIVTYNSHLSWLAYGLNALVTIVWPVCVSHLILKLVERWLPPNFFIYIFVACFFGAAATVILTGVLATLVLLAAGAYGADYLFSQYLPYFILMGFSEAFLTGMSMTIMVVYQPDWVSSFDDERYLTNK